MAQITGFVPITGYAEASMHDHEQSSYYPLKETDRTVHIPESRWYVDYVPGMFRDYLTQAINFGAHLSDIDIVDASSIALKQ